ncbi:MAG: oligosaccharide flippase family protein, partial [Bacteroidales bacterium]|nr:oligosaccharide flippase family protein [Bacteroidales bacterium]
PIATMVTEFLILIVLIKPISKNVTISFKKIKKKILSEIGKYSIPGIATNLGILLLTSGDRYIISIFCDMRQVGIYNQIYNFSQISIMALVQVFFSVINPEFLKALEYHPEKINKYLFQYYKYYLILLLPIVFYVSIFAKPISVIFFGEDFREGYDMIPYVAFSAFINGFILFRDNKFKFEKKYKLVIIGFLLATVINLVLNFILIPLYGYKMAALTTLISYFILYLYYYINDSVKLTHNRPYLIIAGKTIILLIIQAIVDFFIRKLFAIESNILFSIIEGVIFLSVYVLIIVKPNIQTKQAMFNSKDQNKS